MLQAQHISPLERLLRAPVGAVRRELAAQEPYWIPVRLANPDDATRPPATGQNVRVRGLSLANDVQLWAVATDLNLSRATIYLANGVTPEAYLIPLAAQSQSAGQRRRSYRMLTPLVIPAFCDWWFEAIYDNSDSLGASMTPQDPARYVVLQGVQLTGKKELSQ